MARSQMPPEKLGLSKRGANHVRLPVRIANSWLPAIQKSPKSLRPFSRLRELTRPKNDQPFNYHELLKEIGHNEPKFQVWPRLSDIPHANLKIPDNAAEGRDGSRCANCIQLAKSQRETAASLEVARNVIESLEASVTLLQTRLERYERDNKALGHAASRPLEEKLQLSTKEGKTENGFAAPVNGELNLHRKVTSAERSIASPEKGAESSDPIPADEPPFAATDVTASGQDDKQTYKDTARTLMVFGATIRALAAVLVTQSRQIEQLKSANVALTTRRDRLVKDLQATQAAQRGSRETILFQAEAAQFLVSELQTERSAAEYDKATLLYALRHERSERRAAECKLNAIKSELVFLLPKLITVSKAAE